MPGVQFTHGIVYLTMEKLLNTDISTAPFPSLYLSLNSPVQRIVLHPEIVSREVAGRVAEVVELVPEYAAVTRRSRYDGHLDGEVDLGLECLSS